MKTFKFFALVGLLFLLSPFQPTAVARLEQTQLDVIPNYVVIGAFSKQTNAIRFTDHAQKDLKLDAKFEMNVRRNLYYVYVLNTEDLALLCKKQGDFVPNLNSEIPGFTGDLLMCKWPASPIVITPTVEPSLKKSNTEEAKTSETRCND